MRKLLLLALILTTVFQWPPSSQAKGVSDRIVISSLALAEDIIVEDDGIVYLLMYMVDFGAKLPVPPSDVDLATAYRLQRQYFDGREFHTLDHVAYYQGKDGGYVHYMGLGNGSSVYDSKWYRVYPESDLAMQYILTSQHLTDYIIAYQTNGQFQLLDPATLETAYTFETNDMKGWAYAFNGGAALDGTKLFFQRNSGSTIEEMYLDLPTQKLCSTGNHAFIMPTLDGRHLLFQVNNTIEMRNAETFELVAILDDIAPDDLHHRVQFFTDGNYIDAFGTIWDNSTQTGELFWLNALTLDIVDRVELNFSHPIIGLIRDTTTATLHASDGSSEAFWEARDQSINFSHPVRPLNETESMQKAGVMLELIGVYHGEQYYYPRIGRYWKLEDYEVAGGIMVVRQQWADEDISWFQPEIPFQHVIMQGNHLYALEVPLEGDTATIYRLDLVRGEILNSIQVSADVHRLEYARLDTTTLKQATVTFGSCTEGALFD